MGTGTGQDKVGTWACWVDPAEQGPWPGLAVGSWGPALLWPHWGRDWWPWGDVGPGQVGEPPGLMWDPGPRAEWVRPLQMVRAKGTLRTLNPDRNLP